MEEVECKHGYGGHTPDLQTVRCVDCGEELGELYAWFGGTDAESDDRRRE